jgi:hypothetical protein
MRHRSVETGTVGFVDDRAASRYDQGLLHGGAFAASPRKRSR